MKTGKALHCTGKNVRIPRAAVQRSRQEQQGALALYKKLGFTQLGVIPGGFLNKDGEYEDIIPHYQCSITRKGEHHAFLQY